MLSSNKKSLFDMIAPFYALFYNRQKKNYDSVLSTAIKELNLSTSKKIIDIGCGTGALCSAFYQKGFDITGIDYSKRMIDIALKKHKNKPIRFIYSSILEKLPFDDKSFDVSIASYVAHGLKGFERKIMYGEMRRITKDLVIIYDYNQRRSFFTNIIEWLEGGDYFNFIKNIKKEMAEFFYNTRVLEVDLKASWYIGTPDK